MPRKGKRKGKDLSSLHKSLKFALELLIRKGEEFKNTTEKKGTIVDLDYQSLISDVQLAENLILKLKASFSSSNAVKPDFTIQDKVIEGITRPETELLVPTYPTDAQSPSASLIKPDELSKQQVSSIDQQVVATLRPSVVADEVKSAIFVPKSHCQTTETTKEQSITESQASKCETIRMIATEVKRYFVRGILSPSSNGRYLKSYEDDENSLQNDDFQDFLHLQKIVMKHELLNDKLKDAKLFLVKEVINLHHKKISNIDQWFSKIVQGLEQMVILEFERLVPGVLLLDIPDRKVKKMVENATIEQKSPNILQIEEILREVTATIAKEYDGSSLSANEGKKLSSKKSFLVNVYNYFVNHVTIAVNARKQALITEQEYKHVASLIIDDNELQEYDFVVIEEEAPSAKRVLDRLPKLKKFWKSIVKEDYSIAGAQLDLILYYRSDAKYLDVLSDVKLVFEHLGQHSSVRYVFIPVSDSI